MATAHGMPLPDPADKEGPEMIEKKHYPLLWLIMSILAYLVNIVLLYRMRAQG